MKVFFTIILCMLTFYVTSFGQCSNPYAGQDTAVCSNTYTLNVENATTGYWTAYVGDDELTPEPNYVPSNTNADATVTVPSIDEYTQMVTFVWTDDSGPCNDTVLVEFLKQPQAYAGEDFDVCGSCGELNASLNSMSGFWLANGAAYDNYSSPNTNVCVSSYGDKTFQWYVSNSSTISSVSCTDIDMITVTFWREPTANILTSPADSVTCGLSCDFLRAENPGSGVTGHWECSTCGPTWWYPDIIPEIQVSSYGYNVFYWIEETGPALNPGFCTDTAGPLIIHFLNDHPLYAGYDEDAFGFEHVLHGLSDAENDQFAECIYLWENEDAIIENPNSLETNVIVTDYGDYEFVLSSYYVNIDECYDSDTVVITFLEPANNQSVTTDNISIRLFPNPVFDILNIESEWDINKLEILDLNGRIVLNPTNINKNIDISELEAGVYFAKILFGKSTVCKKFIKQ